MRSSSMMFGRICTEVHVGRRDSCQKQDLNPGSWQNTFIPSADLDFYEQLPAFDDFREIANGRHFVRVPDDWHVIATDVRDSTLTVQNGKYKEVNILGAASVAGALNACGRKKMPFMFGGDGATILVPSEYLPAIRDRLRQLAGFAREAFGMTLRVGAVPVRALRESGFDVLVAKLALSPTAHIAMFSGGGMSRAEELIKMPGSPWLIEAVPDVTIAGGVDDPFSGLECRWQPISSARGIMLSILVMPLDSARAHEICHETLEALEHLVPLDKVRPLSQERLKLADGASLAEEASLRQGAPATSWSAIKYRWKAQLLNHVGRAMLRLGKTAGSFDGKTYKQELVAHTDFRKFDGILRMTIDVTPQEHQRFEQYLEGQRQAGKLLYGLHVQPAALVTCVVFRYKDDHIHFIDGAGGGYTMAARGLKAQIKSRQP